MAKTVSNTGVTAGLVVMLGLMGCAEAETPPAHLAIPGADPAKGKELIAQYGCGACHFVDGVVGANGILGPRLEDFATRTLIAGTFPNAPRTLVPWLLDPPALKPQTGMPAVGLLDAEARDIASYLYTLRSAEVSARPQVAVTDVAGAAVEALRSEQEALLQGAPPAPADRRRIGIERAMEMLAIDGGS
jgi:mono/diheme cytochrome c family protein